ncbi:MAG: hypothetical protein HQK51_01345 [Oligoflexia bacterium]|nr:hypothetical protein [Oligoflexia bacterium]
MDFNKVILKYKMNTKGTHYIAYCDEYPSLQGIGPSEGHATANFWKAFNSIENKDEHQKTINKKSLEIVEDNKKDKKHGNNSNNDKKKKTA